MNFNHSFQKSFSMFPSRFVWKGDMPREGFSADAGEVTGKAVNKLGDLKKTMDKIPAKVKASWKDYWESYDANAHPQVKEKNETELQSAMIAYIAQRNLMSEKNVRDALYKGNITDTESQKIARENILKQIGLLQKEMPEMQLVFAGAARPSTERLESHDLQWYKNMKETFSDMLANVQNITPMEIQAYVKNNRNEIEQYIRAEDPRDVVSPIYNMPKFLRADGDRPKEYVDGNEVEKFRGGLFTIAEAYRAAIAMRKAVSAKNTYQSTIVYIDCRRNLSNDANKSGIMMQHNPSVSLERSGSKVQARPADADSADEAAPELLDPEGTLNKYAKSLGFKGLSYQKLENMARFDPKDISDHAPAIKRALKQIADKKYADVPPASYKKLLGEIEIVLTPNDWKDVNLTREGLDWDDGKIYLDYNEGKSWILFGESRVGKDVDQGVREYFLRKKSGASESPEVHEEREHLATVMKEYIDNFNILFPKNDAALKTWNPIYETASDPIKYAEKIAADPNFPDRNLLAIEKSVKAAYVAKLQNYIHYWDAKIGVGAKDGGDYDRQAWEFIFTATKNAEPSGFDDVAMKAKWMVYMTKNLNGNKVKPPKSPTAKPEEPGILEKGKRAIGIGETDAAKKAEAAEEAQFEKLPEDQQRAEVEHTLALVSQEGKLKVELMPPAMGGEPFVYDYNAVRKSRDTIRWALRNLSAADKIAAGKIGVALTPDRSVDTKTIIRHTGLQTLPDGSQKIYFDYKDTPAKIAAQIQQGVVELSGASGTDSKEEGKRKWLEQYTQDNIDDIKRLYLATCVLDDDDLGAMKDKWKTIMKAFETICSDPANATYFKSKHFTVHIYRGEWAMTSPKYEGTIGPKQIRIDCNEPVGSIIKDLQDGINAEKERDEVEKSWRPGWTQPRWWKDIQH